MSWIVHAGLTPPLEDAVRAAGAVAGVRVEALVEPIPPDAAVLLGLDRAAIRRLLRWRGSGVTAPIVVIGGTDAETADAFRAGADSALPALPEVVALRAVELARAPRVDAVLQLGDRTVDLARGTVRHGEETQPVSVTEARLLRYLAARPGRPISQEELLREVWGYASTVTSRVVRVTIQRLRQKIERDPSKPVFVVSDIGRGYRFVAAERGSAPVDFVASVRSNVVVPDDTFVGGATILTRIDAAVRSDRAVALVGPGGVGKTRLSRQYAAGHARATYAAIWAVDLGASPSVDEVIGRIAEAVGVPLAGLREEDAVARLRAALIEQASTLLLFDGCEHLDASVLDHLASLVASAPKLAILLTTRVATEARFVHIEVQPLPAAEGLELLVDRARRGRPTFPVNEATRAACAQIVARVEGLPLAIELAASRLAILDPRALLAGLEHQFGLLSDPSRSDRGATLRASITASWELVEAGARAAAGALSTCEGGFDFAAAQAITELEAVRCADVLGVLLRNSLLHADTGPDGTIRYRYLESTRDFVQEVACDEAARDRHAAWFARFADARAAEEDGPFDVAAAKATRTERRNLAAAFSRLQADTATAAAAAKLGMAVDFGLRRELPLAESNRWLSSAADAAERAGDNDLMVCTQARLARARHLAGEAGALEGLRRLEGRSVGALARAELDHAVGILAKAGGDYELARARLEASVAAFAALGRPATCARLTCELAEVHRHFGDVASAEGACRRGIGLLEACGAQLPLPQLLGALATVYSASGRPDDAEPWFVAACARAVETDPALAALLLSNLGNSRTRQGRHAEAVQLQRQATTELGRLGMRGPAAIARLNLGNNLLLLLPRSESLLDEAEATLVQAEHALAELANRRAWAWALAGLGRIRLARGRAARARHLLTAAEDIFLELGLLASAAATASLLGASAAADGDPDAGEAILARVLRGSEPTPRLTALHALGAEFVTAARLPSRARAARLEALRHRLYEPMAQIP